MIEEFKNLPGELIDIDEREAALQDFYNQEKSDKDFDFMVNNMTEKDVWPSFLPPTNQRRSYNDSSSNQSKGSWTNVLSLH